MSLVKERTRTQQTELVAAPILSIVVVNWNTRDLLAQCLESISSEEEVMLDGENYLSTAHYPLVTEVLVVDNASTDGSTAMVHERFPWVRCLVNRENLGFAAANNQAIQRARGRYLALLNSDTEVQAGAMAKMVTFMDTHPRAAAVGARLLNSDGSLQPSCHPMLTPGREFWRLLFLDRLWPRATYRMHKWDLDEPRQVEVIKGACLVIRRHALDEVGLLDNSYFMYTEEVDLCYRLAQAGWEMWWVPQAQVIHHDGQSARQAAEAMYVQLYRSKVQFYRKFGGEPCAARFKRLLRLAYWPRLVIATVLCLFSTRLGTSSRIYRHLLAGLSEM